MKNRARQTRPKHTCYLQFSLPQHFNNAPRRPLLENLSVLPQVHSFLCPVDGCGFVSTTVSGSKKHRRAHNNSGKLKDSPAVGISLLDGLAGDAAGISSKAPRSSSVTEVPVHLLEMETFRKKFDVRRNIVEDVANRPFPCPVEGCLYHASRKGAMASHLRTHSGEKSHVCTVEGCSYRGMQSSDLKKHLRTHTPDAKVFSCPRDFCQYSCSDPSAFVRHQKRRHPDFPCVSTKGILVGSSTKGSMKAIVQSAQMAALATSAFLPAASDNSALALNAQAPIVTDAVGSGAGDSGGGVGEGYAGVGALEATCDLLVVAARMPLETLPPL